MRKWKVLCLLLFLALVAIGVFKGKDKIEQQKEVASYVSSVNEWNDKQDKMQLTYEKDVLNVLDQNNLTKDDMKQALLSLSNILDENNSLLKQTERFDSHYPQLDVVRIRYQEGLTSLSTAYQFFYYAIEKGDKSILKAGEKSLEESNVHLKEHEVLLSDLAKKNFITLQ